MSKKKNKVDGDNGKGPAVKFCPCTSAFQDKRYGEGKRVHSRKVTGRLVCSVCGTERG